jgi:hypothetical protein
MQLRHEPKHPPKLGAVLLVRVLRPLLLQKGREAILQAGSLSREDLELKRLGNRGAA